jgi:hypothetical protein
MKAENNENQDESETLLPTLRRFRPSVKVKNKLHAFIHWVVIVCSLALTCAAGIFIGNTQSSTLGNYGLPGNDLYTNTTYLLISPVPPGSVLTKWHHNLTFTQKPDKNSEAAWGSLIPVGRGFITHPHIAAETSNIAVFHQIHCLVSLLCSCPSRSPR